jgi:hypothetical protein
MLELLASANDCSQMLLTLKKLKFIRTVIIKDSTEVEQQQKRWYPAPPMNNRQVCELTNPSPREPLLKGKALSS